MQESRINAPEDIEALADEWGLPSDEDERRNLATLELARYTIRCLVPRGWTVTACAFDAWNACGFGVTLPNGWRNAWRCAFPPRREALVGISKAANEWGEAKLSEAPP